MKRFTVLLVLLLMFTSYPQADLMIDFLMYDNATPPNNGSWELTFGLDSTATDGIDAHLGEFPVPPDVCCGWGGPILCSQFILPIGANTTWIDYRFGELPYTGTKEHIITYCSDTSSTVVTIQCSLPSGVTATLDDLFGGIFIHIVMSDSNEYHIYDPYIGSAFRLKLTVNYNDTVPVELKSFTGSFLNSSIQLYWTTATETNNSGFEIERASSMTTPGQGWENIGFVPGFGTITEPKSYSFIDENVTTGTYKYRLKQIDFDGMFTYSNEIEVEVDYTPQEFVLYQNYPNPFNPNTVISYQLPVSGNVTVKVYDILGNEVATLVNEEQQPGVYEVKFDAASIASGLYLYKLQAGAFIQTNKMVLLK